MKIDGMYFNTFIIFLFRLQWNWNLVTNILCCEWKKFYLQHRLETLVHLPAGIPGKFRGDYPRADASFRVQGRIPQANIGTVIVIKVQKCSVAANLFISYSFCNFAIAGTRKRNM